MQLFFDSARAFEKVEFYGKARTNLLHQNLNVEEDTTNANKANYGHSLIDLGILVRPSNSTEIISDLRIRNEHGGFLEGQLVLALEG